MRLINMKVYALKGNANCGKTTTLKLLFLEIAENTANKILFYIKQRKTIKPEPNKKLNASCNNAIKGREIAAVLQVNDKTIGIYSAGDNEKEINNAIEFFNKYNCSVAFCACRTKGASIKLLKNYFRDTVKFIKKADLQNANEYRNYNAIIDELNAWQANEIFLNYVK